MGQIGAIRHTADPLRFDVGGHPPQPMGAALLDAGIAGVSGTTSVVPSMAISHNPKRKAPGVRRVVSG